MADDYDPEYWRALRANRGSTPTRVDAEVWWARLEVMYPRNWRNPEADDYECFAVDEPQTTDLYTWLARVGQHDMPGVEYWEFIAPDESTDADLLVRIDEARRP